MASSSPYGFRSRRTNGPRASEIFAASAAKRMARPRGAESERMPHPLHFRFYQPTDDSQPYQSHEQRYLTRFFGARRHHPQSIHGRNRRPPRIPTTTPPHELSMAVEVVGA